MQQEPQFCVFCFFFFCQKTKVNAAWAQDESVLVFYQDVLRKFTRWFIWVLKQEDFVHHWHLLHRCLFNMNEIILMHFFFSFFFGFKRCCCGWTQRHWTIQSPMRIYWRLRRGLNVTASERSDCSLADWLKSACDRRLLANGLSDDLPGLLPNKFLAAHLVLRNKPSGPSGHCALPECRKHPVLQYESITFPQYKTASYLDWNLALIYFSSLHSKETIFVKHWKPA